ncbi:MAG: c-type cytochrome [bacterium]
MRQPVAGTVARGELFADDVFYHGKTARGDTVRKIPVPVTMQLLERGQDRYNIFCWPCHGGVGEGNMVFLMRGMIPPPSLHLDYMRNYTDGHIFLVITHGIRNMSAYGYQIPAHDRWAIVAYVRALQRSQHATIDDLPEKIRSEYE